MYSVLINKRPIKIAFLVNPTNEDWQEWLDAIWKYNQEQWGGRYNPVFPTDGVALEEDWWLFLQEIDPDYVISTVPLSQELVMEIELRISPIEVEILKRAEDSSIKPHIFTYNEGIPIRPSPTNLRKLSRDFIYDPVLALIDSSEYTEDKTFYRFILRSFGLFPNVIYMDRALEKVERRHRLRANDKSELLETLKFLSQPAISFVFPIQFSALGQVKWVAESDYKYSYDVCLLIIGDTFEEQVFTWNKVHYASGVPAARFNHIWIPTALAKDHEIAQALGTWLRRVAGNIHLCSFSLSANELNEIGNQMTETAQMLQPLYRDVIIFNEFPFPKYYERSSFSHISVPKEADYYRAYNLNDGFEIKSPSQTEDLSERGNWMAEVYTEADMSRLYNYKLHSQSGQYWWQFPRKNYLTRSIFKANSQLGTNARVNSSGIPCILLPAKNPILTIDLPSEFDLIRRAIEGDYHVEGKESYSTSLSNIGGYLTGFLKIFGSLDAGYQVLSSRYWRKMFDVLSKRDLTKDSTTFQNVKNTLIKKADRYGSIFKLKQEIDNLTEFVIRLAKQTNFESKALAYNDFLTEAQNELKEFNEKEGESWEFEEEALRRDISEMLELGILLIGLSQTCPRCGSANWYQVNEVNQTLTCTGCRFTFSLPAEPQWSYRLSSLVHQGIALHGLVPVVLVLGQILRRSRSSFFFSPSLDFYKVHSYDPPNSELLGDLDVVCISDGKLIIGEIKLSQSLFEMEQMMKLADVATITSADVLLFSSLDIHPKTRTVEMIDKVREKLKDTKVKVEWYQLEEHIFEPEPIR